MNDFLQKQLLVNYLLGICTYREEKEVENWLDEDRDNCLLLEQVARELGRENRFLLPEEQETKKELFRKIDQTTRPISPEANDTFRNPAPQTSFYTESSFWLKVAAVILVVFMSGIIGIYLESEQSFETQSDRVLKRSSISNGQLATLQFGDGSVVKLNGGSTLSYPETFDPDRREVYLEGEAFFDVNSDPSRPFIVHTGNITTEVLGTAFNIKAYDVENEVQVTVAEGLVAVAPAADEMQPGQVDNKPVLLEKNQWLTYRSFGRNIEKGEGNIREMIAWKDRVLLFSNKSFGQVAEMLERWYGVEILIDDPDLKSQILEGEHRDVSLEEVLSSLQLAMNFEYDFDENNKVRIY